MKRKAGHGPLFLECVTDFHVDATINIVVVARTGPDEESGGEREGFHLEARGDGGIEAKTVTLHRYRSPMVIFIVNFIIVDSIVPVVVVPEVERGAGGDVDERFQCAGSVKVVAVVEEERHALAVVDVDGIAHTDTEQVVGAVEFEAVDEDAVEADVASQKEAILVDHIVGESLLRLRGLACRLGKKRLAGKQ